jgi:hypothetical protein
VVNAQASPASVTAAIHHWIILDIPTIIESDELMPNHLRINPKGDYRQPEENENIGSSECGSVADPERFRRFDRWPRRGHQLVSFAIFLRPCRLGTYKITDNRPIEECKYLIIIVVA